MDPRQATRSVEKEKALQIPRRARYDLIGSRVCSRSVHRLYGVRWRESEGEGVYGHQLLVESAHVGASDGGGSSEGGGE